MEGLPSPRIPIWLQFFAATMVIIITGYATVETARDAMKGGAVALNLWFALTIYWLFI